MDKNTKIGLRWMGGLAEQFELKVDPITALSLAHIFTDAKVRLNIDLSEVYGKATFVSNTDKGPRHGVGHTLKLMGFIVNKYRGIKDNSNEHLDKLRRLEIERYWEVAKLIDDEEEFVDCDDWEHTEPGDEYSRNYYVTEDPDKDNPDDIMRRYILRFIPNSSQVMDEIVRDEEGDDIDFTKKYSAY
jgi:hypothetical protein